MIRGCAGRIGRNQKGGAAKSKTGTKGAGGREGGDGEPNGNSSEAWGTTKGERQGRWGTEWTMGPIYSGGGDYSVTHSVG